jgi:hypothetical protein
MKKLLLSTFGALAIGFQAFAQPVVPNTYVLYSGDKNTDFINGDPYNFDNGLTIVETGTTDKFYKMTGTTASYFVGGAGTGSYGATGNPTISFSGDIDNTDVAFTANTQGKDLKLILAFANAGKSQVWGYEFTIPASTTPTVVSAPLSSFKLRDPNYNFTGASINATQLSTISEFEFGLTYVSDGGAGTAELDFDNFLLVETPTTPVAEYVLYSGQKNTDFINGDPYNFDNGLTIVETGTNDKFYKMTGSTTGYYVGGGGTGSFGATGNPTINYSGQVANTTVAFTAVTQGKELKLIIVFGNSGKSKVWGYEFVIPASTTPTVVSAPLGLFKLRDANFSFTGSVINEVDLASISEFEFGLTYVSDGGVGSAELYFDNFMLVDSNPTGINNSNISNTSFLVYPNPCNTGTLNLGESEVSYSMSTATGVVVKTGVGNKVDVSNLEKGMYLISIGKGKVSKVILN